MSMKRDHLRALARVCRELGGRLEVLSQRAFDALFYDDRTDHKYGGEELNDAPFTGAHGLWWRKKIIYAVRGREEVGSIIHEMGHVFAAQHHPDCHCGKCHEWHWFGWEIVLARKIGAAQTWSRQNHDYATVAGKRWGNLSVKQRRDVVTSRLRHARKIGVLDADGAPRSVR